MEMNVHIIVPIVVLIVVRLTKIRTMIGTMMEDNLSLAAGQCLSTSS